MSGRKSSFRLAAAALAFGIAVPAMPLSAQVTAVTGAGSRTCAQMQTDISELPNVRRAYVSWMQGYLSGRNAAREAADAELVDLADYEAQWDWVTRWCASRPDRRFVAALAELFGERAARLDSPVR